MRQLTDEWKQPFQKEYTERSVNQAFDKLLSLRADVERTMEKVLGKPVEVRREGHAGNYGARSQTGANQEERDESAEAGGQSKKEDRRRHWILKAAWNRSGSS